VSKKLIVVGADWCGACKGLTAALKNHNIEFEYMDGDTEEGMTFCQYHGVRSLPTSFIIEDNDIVKIVIGNKASEIVEGLK
jgi:glutaredoxin